MKKLNEDIDRQKSLMNIVNLSDIQKTGTWSPDTILRFKKGRDMYQIKNNKFVKIHKEPKRKDVYYSGKPKEIYFLTTDEAITVNNLMDEISEYQSKINNLKEKIDLIVGNNIK